MLSLRPKEERTLDALGSPTRRPIICLLAPGSKSVGEIAAVLPVSRPAVSKHLRILENAHLVAFEQQGNKNVFRLDPNGFEVAKGWLESFWDEALEEFVSLADNIQEGS